MNRTTKILIGALSLSLLLNIACASIVLEVLKLRATVKKLISEIKVTSNVRKRTFISHIDGVEDMFAVQQPLSPQGTDHPLVVYLHGMGSNYMEPFIFPTKENPMATGFAKRWPKLCVLSCSYRQEASWGNDKAMSDITQNIREVEQQFPINKIVIAGTSMGGGSALTYAVEAPPDIKKKIIGLVCVEGTGDLAELYNTTHSPQIKSAIKDAFEGTPDQKKELYERKSFVGNIDRLSANVRVAVVSALKDDVVPASLQSKIVETLKKANRPVHFITVNTPHAVPSVDVYVEALAFALGQD